MDILVSLGVKLVTELDLSFEGFVDGIERPTTTLGEIKLFEHSLCSHYPFNLGVKLRTQDYENNQTQEVLYKQDHPHWLLIEEPTTHRDGYKTRL